MRKLESIITEFVGDLLRTIGEANVDDLRELFASAPQGGGVFRISSEPLALRDLPDVPSRPVPAPRTTPGDARRHGASPRRAFLPLSSLPPVSPPPGVAEITDPESLLSLGNLGEASGANGVASTHGSESESAASTFVEPRRAHARTRAHALLEVSESATPAPVVTEPDSESPASGVRSVGSGPTIKLSDNETLARVSNAGVVIRRKKRA
jgi:hypothetical protein